MEAEGKKGEDGPEAMDVDVGTVEVAPTEAVDAM